MNINPLELFKKLLENYGPQHWWPGKGFEIAIGAILTQNTSWKNVELAIKNLKSNNLTTPKKILESDLNFLKNLIKPVGFFNQKALYLKNLSKFWLENPKPKREDLLEVRGIGEETADSILLYLFNEPQFIIDAYTIRISQRIGFNSSSKKDFWKEFYKRSLPEDTQLYNEFHALFVAHGKKLCKKILPLCEVCFIKEDCLFNQKKRDGFYSL